MELIDLNQLIREVRHNLRPALVESSAVLTWGPLPSVPGYGAHFVQLFQNLIGNSIKYRAERPLTIHVSAEKFEDEWRFAVTDNGMGIDPKDHERVFAVFKRLHDRSIPGTGIGLAICQRVVERYGGRIWVESQIDRGSTFYFTIRIHGADASAVSA